MAQTDRTVELKFLVEDGKWYDVTRGTSPSNRVEIPADSLPSGPAVISKQIQSETNRVFAYEIDPRWQEQNALATEARNKADRILEEAKKSATLVFGSILYNGITRKWEVTPYGLTQFNRKDAWRPRASDLAQRVTELRQQYAELARTFETLQDQVDAIEAGYGGKTVDTVSVLMTYTVRQ